MTEEVIWRLQTTGATDHSGKVDDRIMFNSHELKFILDNLITENKVQLFLHSFYAGIETEADIVTSILICGKSGLQTIKAGFFIDCTGDGNLAWDLGMESYRLDSVQSPTPIFLLQGNAQGLDLTQLYQAHREEFDLGEDFCSGWHEDFPNTGSFYKTNLHCHSTVSDGKRTPQEIKDIYIAHGYSIVAYTDHGVPIPPP